MKKLLSILIIVIAAVLLFLFPPTKCWFGCVKSNGSGAEDCSEVADVDSFSKLVKQSNCYILAPNSKTIKIPVSRANESDLGIQITKTDVLVAELLWTDNSRGIDTMSNIADIGIEGEGASGYLLVTPGAVEGNALIAVKVGNEIKWSWHIWVTDYDPVKPSNQIKFPGSSSVSGKDGVIGMSRNIGAMAYKEGNEPRNYGMLYQWGRKDPFPIAASFSGDVEPMLYSQKGITSINRKPAPSTSGKENNLANAVRDPMTFYFANGTSTHDWFVTHNNSQANDYLWKKKGVRKTVYDPCPEGWRVPTNKEYAYFSSANIIKDEFHNNRMLIYNNQRACFPATGCRDFISGRFNNIGAQGYYWSATPSHSTYGYCFTFFSSYVNPSNLMNRASGFVVRCVQE